MTGVLITPAAEADLVNLWVYIAQDNPEAADKVYQAAEETFANLAAMPKIGTLYQPKRARLEGIRFMPIKRFRNYIIYYRQTKQGLEIIRVLHAHMDRHQKMDGNG